MKKLILVIVLIAASFWALSTYFVIESARSKDGTYRMVVVNKKSGHIYKIMGD